MTDSTEWRLPEARAEVRRLQAAVAELSRSLAETSQDMTRAIYARDIAASRLDAVQRELEASHRREAALIVELAACKRHGEAGHTRLASVTPLRPPKGRP